MIRTDHIEKINYIGHCIIPHDTEVIPRSIKPDREEIEFLTSGVAYFEVDGDLKEIGAGAILWHLGGEKTVYKTDPKNPYRVLVISFDVKENIGRQIPRCSFWKERENPELFALDLLNQYNASGYDTQAFCHYVYSRLIWNAHLATVKQNDPFLPAGVKRSMQYIEDNYQQDISVDDIALSAQLSSSYLHKLFKKHLNSSPHQVLLNRRLQEAKSLLSTTELLIKEIAHHCGFVDVINFGRSFKNEVGMTPSQYRSRHTVAITFGESTNEASKALMCD
ncbi:MAG: AraC family transcriptional regulator [Proteobacteria bacterium]|nr:AraC family transcriptional regulator [Pseudomonadota bacterium]